MSLKDLLADGRLRPHQTSHREVDDLLAIVDRDLTDARLLRLSTDRRFATAYNAALQLATIAIHANGYRATGGSHHWATFHVLPEIMGDRFQAEADYFDHCRSKRNAADYDRAGSISSLECEEILATTITFRMSLVAWLRANHPTLAPGGPGRSRPQA